MHSPPRFLRPAALVFLTAALLASATAGRAQNVPLYNDAPVPSTSSTQATSHFLQLITLNVPGPGTYTLNQFSIGVHFTSGTTSTPAATSQSVLVSFYNGVNTSPTAADALATATNAATDPMGMPSSFFGPLRPQSVAGDYTYIFGPPAAGSTFVPLTLTLTGTAVGVEVSLLNVDGSQYSDIAQGRFESASPNVGSSRSFVWNDAGGTFDNTFQGSEQTNFGQSPGAYIRFSLNGIAPAPEPGALAMIGVGATVLCVVARRRLA